ncbi:MAG: hypothetical protein ABJE10_14855 [bacterium]
MRVTARDLPHIAIVTLAGWSSRQQRARAERDAFLREWLVKAAVIFLRTPEAEDFQLATVADVLNRDSNEGLWDVLLRRTPDKSLPPTLEYSDISTDRPRWWGSSPSDKDVDAFRCGYRADASIYSEPDDIDWIVCLDPVWLAELMM